jgi:hypothetical protein
MKVLWTLMLLAGLAAAAMAARVEPPVRQLEKANVLPLALDDRFQFRKVKLFLNDNEIFKPTDNQMLKFERERASFGAVTRVDRDLRKGHYMTFFWRAKDKSDVTVRLEYRQEKLGPFLLAKEVDYPSAKGLHATAFQVIGDEYLVDGKVTMWRALLIVGGKIVGLTQSYLWN